LPSVVVVVVEEEVVLGVRTMRMRSIWWACDERKTMELCQIFDRLAAVMGRDGHRPEAARRSGGRSARLT